MDDHITGVDEVGRGCLAGPVVAAAVILPRRHYIQGLRDSKKLLPEVRDKLALKIRARAIGWAVGLAWPEEIDEVNIYHASRLAMRRAVLRLSTTPTIVMVDGNARIDIPFEQETVVGGDATIKAISAASIIAKVWRDRLMTVMHICHPVYGLNQHKGYATRQHIDALREHGPCRLHRRSFTRVRNLLDPPTAEDLCLPGI